MEHKSRNDSPGYNRNGIYKAVPEQDQYACKAFVHGTRFAAYPETVSLFGRGTVEQIRENPYYHYFIGMLGYEDKITFVPSLLVEFRKRFSEDALNGINETIIEYNAQKSDDNDSNDGDNSDSNDIDNTSDSSVNNGTLILDAICATLEYQISAGH